MSEITDLTLGMWRFLPVPESPEPFPEYLTKSEDSGSFRVLGASVRGKKHKYDGSNGDDRFEITSADKICIAAVADGAGSRRLSRIGAKASVEAVCEALKISFETILKDTPAFYEILSGDMQSEQFTALTQKIAAVMRSAASTAFNAVVTAFEERKDREEFGSPTLSDFASTLLMAAAIPADDGETLVISLTIGDGAVVVFTEDEKSPLTVISVGDKGEFAGETEFLISENVRTDASLKNRTRLTRRKITAAALMTDGVSEDYFPYTPELLRLITDLKLNRVLPLNEAGVGETAGKIIPPPVITPWLNDPDVKFTIAYSKNIIKENNISAAELYFDNALINAAAIPEPLDSNPAEALAIWLDNYTERGSFDDKTLLLIIPRKTI
jgi:serine/threonine protein phosphatase PrpC